MNKFYAISTSTGKPPEKYIFIDLIHSKSDSDPTTKFLKYKFPDNNPYETFQNFQCELRELSREEFIKLKNQDESSYETFHCD